MIKLLLALLLTTSSLLSGEYVSLTFLKPNPCYLLQSYAVSDGVLKIFLRYEPGKRLCTQVIVEDSLRLPKEEAERIEKIEVFTEHKLWRMFER